jgi:hypothetical protein
MGFDFAGPRSVRNRNGSFRNVLNASNPFSREAASSRLARRLRKAKVGAGFPASLDSVEAVQVRGVP